MKNLSLILNVLLLLAVAYLYVDKFSDKKEAEPTEETSEERKPLNIVYINVDTLQANSISYMAMSEAVEKKYKDTQASLRAKERAFQRDVEDYQKQIQSGTLTPKKAQEIEANLGKKQQAFVNQQEQASRELSEETTAFDAKFISDITTIVDSLKAVAGYDYVLLDGGPISPLLTANVDYDITTQVVSLLNVKEKTEEKEEE